MKHNKNIAVRLLALFMALQVFNISMNLNDTAIGKNSFAYINEIETVVELIMETYLGYNDIIPETQVPAGSLGFEEEEKQFTDSKIFFSQINIIPDLLYKKKCFKKHIWLSDHIAEVITPPPQV